ncbi:hypothetical protein C8R48DRAFT_778409 [Suillus tomentosus]|nr:hypothetical protein C8R48DRAFT_778409 [Suillus tomentosus]
MGAMPKQTITQVDYFWAKSNAAAAATNTTPNTATPATPAITNTTNTGAGIGGGGRWQIAPLLSRAAQGMIHTVRDIRAACSC